MIRRSVDYRQDLTNQIRLCKFLVGDTPSLSSLLVVLLLVVCPLLVAVFLGPESQALTVDVSEGQQCSPLPPLPQWDSAPPA